MIRDDPAGTDALVAPSVPRRAVRTPERANNS